VFDEMSPPAADRFSVQIKHPRNFNCANTIVKQQQRIGPANNQPISLALPQNLRKLSALFSRQ